MYNSTLHPTTTRKSTTWNSLVNQVAELLENANQEDDTRGATIHVWIAMTDIIDYKAKGGSVHFAMKNPCEPLNTYFMQCLQRLHDAGRGKNPVIVNVNASGEFLSCNDTTKFKKVTRTIVNELRSEGYMVSWGGPLWREVHTFLDVHGKISGKGLTEKTHCSRHHGETTLQRENIDEMHVRTQDHYRSRAFGNSVRDCQDDRRIGRRTSTRIQLWRCQCGSVWHQFTAKWFGTGAKG